MRELFSRAKGWWKGVFSPLPSFFDLCLAGILITPFINDYTKQSIFFIFYIILLTCISISLKPRRDYRNIPLSLLTIWAFIGIFIHNFVIPCEESVVIQYINLYILSEGFIYILFGAMFVMLVIRHSRNMRFIYPVIPVVLFFALHRNGDFNKTFILSSGLSILIYLLLSKKFLFASISAAGILIFAKLRWSALMVSWACRPYVLRQLWKEICQRPLFGSGFYHGLGHPQEMINTPWGWLYRHCDWLSICAYLGVPMLILLIWAFISSTKRIGIKLALIPMLIIGITSAFQLNFFKIKRASIYLLTIGICIKKGEQR